MAHASIGPAQQLEQSVSIEFPRLAHGGSIDKRKQLMLFEHHVAAIALDTLALHDLTKLDQIV